VGIDKHIWQANGLFFYNYQLQTFQKIDINIFHLQSCFCFTFLCESLYLQHVVLYYFQVNFHYVQVPFSTGASLDRTV
jgi:hypothetical protein